MIQNLLSNLKLMRFSEMRHQAQSADCEKIEILGSKAKKIFIFKTIPWLNDDKSDKPKFSYVKLSKIFLFN